MSDIWWRLHFSTWTACCHSRIFPLQYMLTLQGIPRVWQRYRLSRCKNEEFQWWSSIQWPTRIFITTRTTFYVSCTSTSLSSPTGLSNDASRTSSTCSTDVSAISTRNRARSTADADALSTSSSLHAKSYLSSIPNTKPKYSTTTISILLNVREPQECILRDNR